MQSLQYMMLAWGRVPTNYSIVEAFDNDPCGTLETHSIFLPENMSIEFQRQNADRPRIVVYEQRPNSKFKMRILYLQLVMMAGR